MAYVMSFRNAGAGTPAPSELAFNTITEVLTVAFDFPGSPATIVLTGTTIFADSIIVNYQEKILTVLYDDDEGDYSYNPATKTVTLRFGDDPSQYANGEIIVQVTYAYYV